VDGTITLTLLDTAGNPIEGYPAAEIWLDSTHGNLTPCGETLVHPDGPTDANGVTTFSGALHAGYHSDTDERLRVVVDGEVLTSTNMHVRFNSPDVSGDCVVNLSDIGLFSQVFFNEYDYSCDFNWDNAVNLSDVSLLAGGYGISGQVPQALARLQKNEQNTSHLGFLGEPQGTTSSLAVSPGDPFTAYLMLKGSRFGYLQGWECRAESSENLRILDWELAGQALNIGTFPEFHVGLAGPLSVEEPTLLATVRCQVTDAKPAYLGIAPTRTSSFQPAAPAILLVSGPEDSGLEVAGVAAPLQINAEGTVSILADHPAHTALLPAAPNPFNPQTLIHFEISSTGRVELVVYSIDGRKVKSLVDEVCELGRHEAIWDGRDDLGRAMPSGTYFYRLKTRDYQETRPMLLIK
jgi:hypothetical protein